MQARSHNLVEINSCPILVPELVKATEIARDIARCLLDTDRTLNIQLTLCDTGLDCHVVGKRELDLHTRINLSDCANSYDLARLSVGNDVILERRAPILTFGPGKVELRDSIDEHAKMHELGIAHGHGGNKDAYEMSGKLTHKHND